MSLFGRKLSLSSSRSPPRNDTHKHTFRVYESRSTDASNTALYFILNEQNGDLRLKKSLDKPNNLNLKYMNNIKHIQTIIKCIELSEANNSVRLIIEFKNPLHIGSKAKKGKCWDLLFKSQIIRSQCIKSMNRINVKLNANKLCINEEKMRRPNKWISDDYVHKCQICQDSFNALVRKHHCRNCGGVLCQKCSSGLRYQINPCTVSLALFHRNSCFA